MAATIWGDNRIDQVLSPSPSASGLYDVRVTSGGETPANGLEQAPKGKSGSQSNAGQVNVQGVSMKLQVVSTIISSDGRYSEDSMIQVTAVQSGNCQQINSSRFYGYSEHCGRRNYDLLSSE